MPHRPEGIPVARGWPLLGQLPAFRWQRLRVLTDVPARYGPMATVPLGPFEIILVTDAALAREVLVEQADAFAKSRTLRRFARPLLGDGLLTSERDVHRRQRKLMAPSFSPRSVSRWGDEMVRHGEAAAAGWDDRQVVDVVDEMMRLTLSIVARTLFEVDVAHETTWVGHAFGIANSHAAVESARMVPLPMRLPTLGRRRNADAIGRVDLLVAQLVAERRRSGATGEDMLSQLVRARDEDDGRTMSDGELRDEIMTLFFAGHETTANALAWALRLLARNPSARLRVEREVDEVLGGRSPSVGDLESLPTVLMVLKEAMRLYPPAYLLGRETEREVEIGGVRLAPGVTVGVNVFGMHRRPDVFADPRRFDPDRFTPEREAALPRSAYLPFGAGPRVCIGNHFALMEAHLLLATIAQRVRLETAGSRRVRPKPQITLRPDRLPMRVERRPSGFQA